MKPHVFVYPDKGTVAQAGAQRTLLAIAEDLNERDAHGRRIRERVNVILTGGSDSILSLKLMANNPLVDSIDWKRVHFWWGDERFVPADSDDRNSLQARRALLDDLVAKGDLPESNIHEMAPDTRSADAIASASDSENDAVLDSAARAYEEELVQELGESPIFDLAVMGMGPDGHYASLFPGHHEITITDRLAVGVNHSPKMPPLRVSLTAPLLAQARRTWFLTAGEGKVNALAHVLEKPNNVDYPSSFANGTEEYHWIVTEDALPEPDDKA
ncbi:MAG: 6-phosphogluconolactonase [Bifidobacterium tsurumiense]|uniref:6-phosphogluconolactonase n=1 Tax=Bifidobacterium tsurumiense TaxID=356829 RepID=UPI002A7F2009|nr:6-phosphogluconolactonase [Bifidobacterium tsurumiense]MDY4677747.1 6-phosphogluconolactonase [Bifidobacterium tsurumiense]